MRNKLKTILAVVASAFAFSAVSFVSVDAADLILFDANSSTKASYVQNEKIFDTNSISMSSAKTSTIVNSCFDSTKKMLITDANNGSFNIKNAGTNSIKVEISFVVSNSNKAASGAAYTWNGVTTASSSKESMTIESANITAGSTVSLVSSAKSSRVAIFSIVLIDTDIPTTKDYTLTYMMNDGSDIEYYLDSNAESADATSSKFEIISTTPQRDDYIFLGWSLTTDGDVLEEDTITITNQNVKLYAIWEREVRTFTVKYNTNGHGDAQADLVGVTALPTTLPTLTANGYEFAGWYTDSTFATEALAGAQISQNVTLYAKWIKTSGGVDVTDKVYALNTADLKTASYNSEVALTNTFTFMGSDNKKMTVASKNTTVNNSVDLNTGNGAIKFTPTNDGGLVVVARNTSADKAATETTEAVVGEDRTLVLYKMVDGKLEEVDRGELPKNSKTDSTFTFEVERDVTYYLGSTHGSWYLTSMTLTCKSLNTGINKAAEAVAVDVFFQLNKEDKKLRIVGEINDVLGYASSSFEKAELYVRVMDGDTQKYAKTNNLEYLYKTINDATLGANSLATVFTLTSKAGYTSSMSVEAVLTITFSDGSQLTASHIASIE